MLNGRFHERRLEGGKDHSDTERKGKLLPRGKHANDLNLVEEAGWGGEMDLCNE